MGRIASLRVRKILNSTSEAVNAGNFIFSELAGLIIIFLVATVMFHVISMNHMIFATLSSKNL